jgi:hypothetical protein
VHDHDKEYSDLMAEIGGSSGAVGYGSGPVGRIEGGPTPWGGQAAAPAAVAPWV